MKAAVLFQQGWQLGLREAADGIRLCVRGQGGVQARHGGSQATLQHHLVTGIPFRLRAVGAYLLVGRAGEAQLAKLIQQGGFELGF
jgi:hypothetical protein